MSVKIHLNIGGMTCVNCQNRIEKALIRAEGVISAQVDYNKAIADVEYDDERISEKQIITIIEDMDYEVIAPGEAGGRSLADLISILVIIVALYVLLQSLGILNRLVPSQLADTGMGYGMLFVIGLITSVHCIAMCGGINLSQCISHNVNGSVKDGGRMAALLPSLLYNLGRVCSYTAIGFVLGAVGLFIGGGGEVGLSTFLQGILKMAAGLFMVIMGINMLNLFPWLRKWTIRMPRSVAYRIGKEKARSSRPFIVGVLNGFMPCGPLQSMWIVALATANPFAGALSMLLFSLGTVPLMLGLGSIVSALGRKFSDKVMAVGAVLVVVLGLSMLSQGGVLSGWLSPELLLILLVACCIVGVLLSFPARRHTARYVVYAASVCVLAGAIGLWSLWGKSVKSASASENKVEIVDGVQVVHSTLDTGSYPDITVQAGIPVRWVIDAPEGSINGCNYRMLIQEYGLEHSFDAGENIIAFTPENTGHIRYSCWMGMIHGNIYVTDRMDAGSEFEAEPEIGANGIREDSGAEAGAVTDSLDDDWEEWGDIPEEPAEGSSEIYAIPDMSCCD